MIILNKIEEAVMVDLQNMRKQGATVEKLIFNLCILSKLFFKLHPKETFNEWWPFKLHLIFQLIYQLSYFN